MVKSKCYKYAVIERLVNGENIYYVSPGAVNLSTCEKSVYVNNDLEACVRKREEFENYDNDGIDEDENMPDDKELIEDMEIARSRIDYENYDEETLI
jgi:hypothetical protein